MAAKKAPRVPNKKPLTPASKAPIPINHPKVEKQPSVKTSGSSAKVPHKGQGAPVVTSGRRKGK